MADESLKYSRKSQFSDHLLKMVKPIIENIKFSGKVDDSAINAIIDTIINSQLNSAEFQQELQSKSNDALANIIRDSLSKLFSANVTLLKNKTDKITSSDVDIDAIAKAVSSKLTASTKEPVNVKEPIDTDNVESKINEIKETLGNTSFKKETIEKEQIAGEFTDTDIALNFSTLFNFVNDQFKILANTINELSSTNIDLIKDQTTNQFAKLTSMFNVLNPLKWFKKKNKKPTKEEIKLSKMIDKVNDFIDNFFDRMLGYVDTFLTSVLKSAKKIVNSLMTHILAWLFTNVILIGLLFGFILKLIAEPLMKILLPIMDFVENIVTKILDFLAPVRNFIVNVLQDTWNIIKLPLEGFFRGIGTVAEALGTALGKLIIGIADFYVDVLLPFLRDSLIPVLSSILDVVKELFLAIKPWIKPLVDTIFSILLTFLEAIEPWITPLVDTIFSILLTFLEAIKPWITPLVDVVIAICVSLLDTIKLLFDIIKPVIITLGQFLATVFMDILKGINWTYEKIIKPIVKGIGSFILIIADIGGFIWKKLKRVLPEWMGGETAEDETKRLKEELHSLQKKGGTPELIAEMQKQLNASIQEQIDHYLNEIKKGLVSGKGWDNRTKIKELQSLLIVIKEPSVNTEIINNNEADLVNLMNDETLNTFAATLNDRFDHLNNLLIPAFKLILLNFQLILEKLDDKPTLFPFPMMNNEVSNPALMENR